MRKTINRSRSLGYALNILFCFNGVFPLTAQLIHSYFLEQKLWICFLQRRRYIMQCTVLFLCYPLWKTNKIFHRLNGEGEDTFLIFSMSNSSPKGIRQRLLSSRGKLRQSNKFSGTSSFCGMISSLSLYKCVLSFLLHFAFQWFGGTFSHSTTRI